MRISIKKNHSIFHGTLIVHIIMLTEYAETKPIISIVADICDKEQMNEIFEGVDVVFHCAAYINFQYPPDIDELERVNVNGRINI